jgi:hypothetical protein
MDEANRSWSTSSKLAAVEWMKTDFKPLLKHGCDLSMQQTGLLARLLKLTSS